MEQFYHVHAKGFRNGYYLKEIADKIPSHVIKFLAGPFSLADVNDLREQCAKNYLRKLPIIRGM